MNELRGKSVVDKCILGMKKKRDLTIIVLSLSPPMVPLHKIA